MKIEKFRWLLTNHENIEKRREIDKINKILFSDFKWFKNLRLGDRYK